MDELPPQPGEISFTEAADLLDCSGKELRRLIATGVFHPAMRRIACNVHRSYLPESEVRAWAERDRLRTPLMTPEQFAELRLQRSLEERDA